MEITGAAMYWKSCKDWYEERGNGSYKIKDNAPPRAKASFKMYLEKTKQKEKGDTKS